MNAPKILRIIWAIIWRITLTAVVLAMLLLLGAGMVLNTIFTGPSPTARDALVMTLLKQDSTADIPGYFLDETIIDQICHSADVLPSEHSDPSMIQPSDDGEASTHTVTIGDYTAIVSVTYGEITLPQSSGEHSVGFTADGILVVSTSHNTQLPGRCEKILIMDGQLNTGLYAAASGYAPRCAIGQAADGAVIHVTMAVGTHQHLIDIMTEYGAINACMLSTSEE